MTRLLLSMFVVALTIASKGQIIENRIQRQIDTLKSSKVDTFLIYSFTCNGGLMPFDTCAYEKTQYLFWTQNTKTFLQRYDYCKRYKAIQLDTINPLVFY